MYSKKKVAAYCRVSTDMEDQLHSLVAQRQYFEEYINEHENWELIEIYYDEGITGTSTRKREGFNRMISDCEMDKIDTVLTKEVSRFARNTVDTLNYTRHLKELNINVIFMSDGIDTNDKDGELRLTIMASLAQEESRKTSERVKWGMRRSMEKGFVFGNGGLLGYKITNGKLEIVPEEAEIVRRIFHEYVNEGKGAFSIAKGLNNDGFRATTGNLFRQDSIMNILKNEKYCGDLVQWRVRSTDFLTKKKVVNRNENPDTPVIAIENTHEGIISKEMFLEAQRLREQRTRKSDKRGRYSNAHWYSTKIVCGKCGAHFSVTGNNSDNPPLRCNNRKTYGTKIRIDTAGKQLGCDISGLAENTAITCMKYVLSYIDTQRDVIIKELKSDIETIQCDTVVCDIAPLQAQIDKLVKKKQGAIDLMLEGLITKDDMKNQTKKYEDEIAEISRKIYENKNIGEIHNKQLEKVKEYIDTLSSTAIDIESKTLYRELLDRMITYENCTMDIYLNCLPFGFRLKYHKEIKPGTRRNHLIVIDECSNI